MVGYRGFSLRFGMRKYIFERSRPDHLDSMDSWFDKPFASALNLPTSGIYQKSSQAWSQMDSANSPDSIHERFHFIHQSECQT